MSVNTSTISTLKNYPPPVADDTEIYYSPTDPSAMPETDIHFKLIANLVLILQTFLSNRADANVFGDIMFYYEKGNSQKFVAPDVMICFGTNKTPRKTYRLWDENEVVPAVIIEAASQTTWLKDVSTKLALYQKLGVKEYYVYDAEYANLPVPLMAYRLDEFNVLAAVEIENNRIFSQSLGLELVDTGETLRFFNPEAGEFLMTMEEMAVELAKLKAEIQNGGK